MLLNKMALPSSNITIKSIGFRKCGEISAAVKVAKNVYAFHCTFCAVEDCLPLQSFENFMLHMEELHSQELDLGLDEEHTLHEDEAFLAETNKDCGSMVKKKNSTKKRPAKVFEEVTPSSHTYGIKKNDVTPFLNGPLDETPLIDLASEFPKSTDENIKDKLNFSDHEVDNLNEKVDYTSKKPNKDSNETSGESESDMDPGDRNTQECLNKKGITLAIIDSYREQRLLWDEDDPNGKNRKKRREAIKQITSNLNEQLGLHLKLENIQQRIKRMRHKIRTQKINKGHNTSLWYYDKLAFLNPVQIGDNSNKSDVLEFSNEKATLPISGLTDVQTIELIEIYKSFPCLWDVEHTGYRFQNQRQETLSKMLQAINNKMNLEFTLDELQEIINCIRHIYTDEKDIKLQCDRANEEFTPKSIYYENICFLEPHVGPFQCDFCEQNFNSVDQYRIHKFKHDGVKPFICSICNHGFIDSGNYKVHLRRHTRDYPFECQVCGKHYATTTDIKGHMRLHTGEKPYFCEVCGNSFRTQSIFSSHKRRHLKQPPSLKCSICMRAFYEKSRLNEHLKRHRNVRDKVCNVCGKAFTTANTLRQHKQIHAEKKRYDCKICGREFAQYAGISGHMKSHGTTMSGAFAAENC